MQRREFITLLGGAAAAWPLAARAQQAGKIARIGFLGPSRDSPPPIAYYQAFLARLRALGFSEGETLRVEYRALNDPRGPFVAAAELVRSQPDLIVVEGPELSLQAVVGASGSTAWALFWLEWLRKMRDISPPGIAHRTTVAASEPVEIFTAAAFL